MEKIFQVIIIILLSILGALAGMFVGAVVLPVKYIDYTRDSEEPEIHVATDSEVDQI